MKIQIYPGVVGKGQRFETIAEAKAYMDAHPEELRYNVIDIDDFLADLDRVIEGEDILNPRLKDILTR